ncbi:DUF4238 domain-containing protein [Pantoea sp. USHLN256]|uniref:DUF4238 domain-containing protein n=1 Tax=Pantoea sp. USHLN256 TaxID=3081293 RepID=UPI003017A44E
MAGKRHHYIPRFLQRGFLSSSSKKEYTYVYLIDGGIRPSNINNVGVEGFFYSVDGETDLDDLFTDLENVYATTINKARHSPLGDINDIDLANIISHLEIRTNNLRESFYTSSKEFLEKMVDSYVSIDIIKPLILKEIERRAYTGGAIDDLFEKMGIPEQFRQTMFDVIRPLLESNLEHHLNSCMAPIRESFSLAINTQLKNVIKKGHVSGMINFPQDNKKLEIYKDLDFQIIKTDFDMILGDSIVLFEFDNMEEFKPFFDIKNSLRAIYFPISSDILIYASKNNYQPKLNILNEMSAKCSNEFFIAAENNPYFAKFQSLIGTNCALLTDAEMQLILAEVIQEEASKYPM